MDTAGHRRWPRAGAHAGCLSFELSHRNFRILVNCGAARHEREHWRPIARSTAAHSTVTFTTCRPAIFMESGLIRRLMRGTPILSGPRQSHCHRDEDDSRRDPAAGVA